MDALIGHTGFVGQNLSRQHGFEGQFNRANLPSAASQTFDTVVCAAAPGSMFEANRDPAEDRRKIEALIAMLGTMTARRFILISSVAVLANFAAVDEGTADFEETIAYGVHRRLLEKAVEAMFADSLIVRLPALYAPGLKKNFLFDIANPMPAFLNAQRFDELRDRLPPPLSTAFAALYQWNEALAAFSLDRAALQACPGKPALAEAVVATGLSALSFTNRDSRYQFYDVGQLWSDIGKATAHGLKTLHLSPPPIAASAIYTAVTGDVMPQTDARIHVEDMGTRHADLWGKSGRYMMDSEDVLAGLSAFAGRMTAR